MTATGNLFELASGIFFESMSNIIDGIYKGAHTVFNNSFFEIALTISFVIIGYMIAFRKIKDEEIAYKIIWTLMVFVFVHTILYQKDWYNMLIEVINLPMEAFLSLIKSIVSSINNEATMKNIIDQIATAQEDLTSYLFDKGGIANLAPFIYGVLVWISGAFLLLVILINGVFSLFLSNVVLSLLPLILPFLVWKKTEYVFFNWVKLYISISLYAPFTLLFGLISIETAEFSIYVLSTVKDDFQNNAVHLTVLALVQVLTALAIFKIPNIINQIIGSSNEGTSLTGGVGTISAGAAALGAVAKYSGLNFAGKAGGKAAGKAGKAVANRATDHIKNKIQMR